MQLLWLSLVPVTVVFSYIYRIFSPFIAKDASSKTDVVKYEYPDVWGTYRSNLYFGMRTKTPQALMTGLAWNSVDDIEGFTKMRHSCELDDHVNFGWKEHNGRSFGYQSITDKFHHSRISVEYLKVQSPSFASREAWTVKISTKPLKKVKKTLSMIFYLGYDGDSSIKLKPIETETFKGHTGWTAEIGHFIFGVSRLKTASVNVIYDQVQKSKLWTITDKFSNLMRSKLQQGYYAIGNEIFNADLIDYAKLNLENGLAESNLLAYQFIVPNDDKSEMNFFYLPYDGKNPQKQVEIHLEALNSMEKKRKREEFHEKIIDKFNLKPNSKLIPFVKYALSNLLGGISYFYGDSEVYSSDGQMRIERTAEGSLFTDVPARANFPRGFYWDSGFHNILIGKWDPKLSLEILSNWIDKIDENGWIGREQILGDEARSKVPREYITQNPKYSNPPAPLLPIEMLTNALKDLNGNEVEVKEFKVKLRKMYPKLVLHFNWFLKTQRARLLGSPEEEFLLRWRGRSDHHTLTSGLDDYPRGSEPSDYELHVDLLSWMAFASRALSNIKSALDIQIDLENEPDFKEMYNLAIRNLNQYHWDESRGCFSDLTVNHDETGLMFVPNIGYVSLFPMLFGLIPEKDSKLEKLLDIIEDPQKLWTDYGIRSLSKSDSFYNEGDKYWTGPIWINLNYLVLSSLEKYYHNSTRACRVYEKLRTNLIENMYKEWKRTGFIWEQYNDLTGNGQRSRPFSGWSSLIAPIIAEDYH